MSIAERYDAYRIRWDETYSGVWAWAPARGGDLTDAALETIGAARRLAEAIDRSREDEEGELEDETEVVAVALGEAAPRLGAECLEHGADTAYVAGHAAVQGFRVGPHAGALEDAIENAFDEAAGPRAVVFPDTADGRDLASVVASRLDAGLVTGCQAFHVEDVRLKDETKTGREASTFEDVVHLVRTTEDGATETLACLDNEARDFAPSCATLSPGAFGKPEREPSRSQTGRILQIPLDLAARDEVVTLEAETPLGDGHELSRANRVVALGRGIHPRVEDGLEHGLALADALDAELGVTRGVATAGYDVDADLDAYTRETRQVGQAGHAVDAEVYIAAGISGAAYHLDAVDADHVLAVNPDPDARIREHADAVLEVSLFEALPRLADAIGDLEEGDA